MQTHFTGARIYILLCNVQINALMVYTVGIGKNLLHKRHAHAAAKAVTGKYNHIHLDEDLIFNLHWLVKKGIVF